MRKSTVFKMYSMIHLALLGALALWMWQSTPTLVRADGGDNDCTYTINQECQPHLGEFQEADMLITLTQYFLLSHDENDCLVFSMVLLWVDDVSVFDGVADPVRTNSPNLAQYNRQQILKARGEIWEWDLEDAINRGDAYEISRTHIVTYCEKIPYKFDPSREIDKRWFDGPFEMTKLAFGNSESYGHLFEMTDETAPDDPSGAILELIPEGMIATFLLVHADEVPFVEELLGQP